MRDISRRKGEAQIPPDQIIRLSAGAAIWKDLCPPANCVGYLPKSRRRIQDWINRWALDRESGSTQPGKTPASGSDSTISLQNITGLGYCADSKKLYRSGYLPTDSIQLAGIAKPGALVG